ncbi:MAG: glucokinase [Proteobacteria bacterium]|nr:glucokinase [Pseudomonadota bacterium]MBU4121444.1 glucokinase [Pseudomonadota bacterium]
MWYSIISALQSGPFMEAFRRKGRMSGLMEGIPVHVMMNPKAALPGAACHGMAANCIIGWEKEILHEQR